MQVISGWANKSAHDLWWLFLSEGIVMVVFGLIAILLPVIAGVATVILLGWLLIASGVVGTVATLTSRRSPGFWWSLLSALLTLAVGMIFFAWPFGGLLTLTIALATFLALDGVLAIALAFNHRNALTPKWIWLLFNGIVDLLFASLICWWLPVAAVWAFGLFVGLDMLISGVTLIGMGWDARRPD
jgi:uncharacterized membrane protein HdeD (DUF308 family)